LKQQEKKRNKNNQHYSKNNEAQIIIRKPEEFVEKLKKSHYSGPQHVVNDTLKLPSYLDNLPYVEGEIINFLVKFAQV